jgi:hypothetical protein
VTNKALLRGSPARRDSCTTIPISGPMTMQLITIDQRFRGPPHSGNGGYVCGLVARNIDRGGAEITLRSPPPLDTPLHLVAGRGGSIQLLQAETLVATGRAASVEVAEVPAVAFGDAEQASRLTPFDEHTHALPTCFVCGPSRAHGDGLRIHAGPAPRCEQGSVGVFAAPWIPDVNLATQDGHSAEEFVWAALDCPTGYACLGARHFGMSVDETILLGRMGARIDECPLPGERCVMWLGRPGGKDASCLLTARSWGRAAGCWRLLKRFGCWSIEASNLARRNGQDRADRASCCTLAAAECFDDEIAGRAAGRTHLAAAQRGVIRTTLMPNVRF